MNPYLWTDYRKLEECLQDSLSRLYCLKSCHLDSKKDLPDFVFPLEKSLKDSLEQVQLLMHQAKFQKALKDHLADPKTQELMRRLVEMGD